MSTDASPNGSADRPLAILYVEDNADLADVVAEYLRELDHDVISAPSAEDALETLRKGRIDVLLTDINLPGMNGIELAKTVAVEFPKVRVILSSGHSWDIDLKAYGLDVITVPKPFEWEALQPLFESLKQSRET